MKNPQLNLAKRYLTHTNKHIFLTGKAGTGKTTFLHDIRKEAHKRMAVVAPTGVAAINAQGVTIHSLFQLPFGTLIPGQLRESMRKRKFSAKKIKLLKSLDLLVIDEVSMVRADVLDAIDEVLRRYCDYSKPFGGVQLLMIGDLHQLPPVVKQHEWDLMRQHYSTPYFFGAKVLQQTDTVMIELQHIYRQSDATFIDLLNQVRANKMDEQILTTLNSRYQPDFQPTDDEGYITLTSHNATADQINAEKLQQVEGKSHKFKATVDGDFPTHAYPNAEELEFKVGAQVMFVKNDHSIDKLYYNGKIGRITKIDKKEIAVLCPGESSAIIVTPAEWTNMKYKLNEKTKEVEENVIGTFTQIPLKLAWAITIHKSQGLTFERVIIDAQAAFAHGQVYVALSRCKSFEGIVLRSKIQNSSVRTDSVVQNFTEEAQKKQPGEAQLEQAKREYQQELLRDLFNFKKLKNIIDQVRRTVLENDNSLQGSIESETADITGRAKNKVINFAQKFRPHLENYFKDGSLPEENKILKERLQKASDYFIAQLKDELLPIVKGLAIITDNTKLDKKLQQQIDELKREIVIKLACFNVCSVNFNPIYLIKAKIDADLDFESKPKKTKAPTKSPKDIEHPQLFNLLVTWRNSTADEMDVPRYQVLPTKALVEIAEVRPTNSDSLKNVSGIGKVRAETFGADIIAIVIKFCKEHGIRSDQLQLATGTASPKPKAPKVDTKKVTYDLYKSGKSVAEIAEERGFVRSTIESHLAHYISLGELNVYDFVEKKKVEAIIAHFDKATDTGYKTALEALGEGYTYGDLNMVKAFIAKDKEQN